VDSLLGRNSGSVGASGSVAVVDCGEVGRSAVYTRYNNGPRTVLGCQSLRGSVSYVNRILG
jgi:hypothetical protein